jgi:thiol-disulfide isomerase/thioredoxin
MKALSILLSLQGVLSFQPIQRRCHRRSSIYQSSPSIEIPRWKVTTFGRDIFPGILYHQATRMEMQNGAVSTLEDTKKNKFESPEILNDLRSKSIDELKLQCSRRSVRYAGLEEHDDLVQAIVNDMNDLQDYSVSGHLYPRSVTDISSDTLEEELGSDIPMLLDVYAPFCGPCKLTHSTSFDLML